MSNDNTIFFSSFGRMLSNILENRGLKQKFLTDKAGKGADEISRYIHDKVLPREKTQKLLASVLGVTFTQEPNGEWSFIDVNAQFIDSSIDSNIVKGDNKVDINHHVASSQLTSAEMEVIINNLDTDLAKLFKQYRAVRDGNYNDEMKTLAYEGFFRRFNEIVNRK
jgi:transcriptional regulator with XRE-family HTH domain